MPAAVTDRPKKNRKPTRPSDKLGSALLTAAATIDDPLVMEWARAMASSPAASQRQAKGGSR
jgi:hypothetical protein